MCGIAGVVGTIPEPLDVGQHMVQRLTHRGPDASGIILLEGPLGQQMGVFAHTRLKVIDLSSAASQPFVSADMKVSLIFNGEIYNFRALRLKLEKRGYVFRTESDTEVILAQYLERGIEGLSQLDGMFAFAIWDARQHRLLLMRDRIGKKPLYWVKTSDGGLAFGSEAKALVGVPGVRLKLDPGKIPEYLTFGYVSTPRSIFSGVCRLEPGTRLVFVPGQCPRIEPYWRLLDSMRTSIPVDVETAKSMVRKAVGRAVERRMLADVPVGAFLSGGVDSSIVVSEMAARSSEPVKTFAVGFADDSSYDETKYARQVAKQFGTEHVELRLAPKAEALFERLLYQHDEPYGDSSALAVHTVSEATREHVTVVLTGDGGDEIFAGYSRFQGGVAKEYIPDGLARILRRVLSCIPEPSGYKHPLSMAQRFVEHAGKTKNEQLIAWNAYFAGERLTQVLRLDQFPDCDVWAPIVEQSRILEEAAEAGQDRLGQILFHNFKTYLLDDLLVKTDRTTMGVGLEARSPFLDTELIELAFQLPSFMKLRNGQLKWLLREAYRNVLGPEVLDRKKHGFGVPVGRWWTGPLQELVSELFGPKARMYEWLNQDAVDALVREHKSGHREHGQRIFALVQLEMFLRRQERQGY
ncbi:MAG: asparagine synthase (glutamine-hydrolyzing) [Myxococcales bacterium]|nr:asparagine synthase (glutamine-hydrolyzing) [Myxococcales bacterium]